MTELKRVLLVEDSPNDAELTLEAFAESGLANEVVWVRDGREALDYLYKEGTFAERPDGLPAVVLLDLKMPKVDGLQVLEQIKTNSQLKTVPVVMLTSSREEADLARSYGLGVNAYVVKPVGFPEFVKALKDLGLFWAVVNEPPPGSLRRSNLS
ncbi:response regulator [Archangium violaceum]|uniref:response regulator n=1 Tax=Archangium violaceum TaxID=83451 RepID=UPI00193C0E23|nr:response regulator [Archangium violaceum]QRK08743.1 response regulator [Archangium violaceum]